MTEPIHNVGPEILIRELAEKAEAEELVLEFLSRADELRQERLPVVEEIEQNIFVSPPFTGSPLYASDLSPRFSAPPRAFRRSFVKDPESHQILSTLTAKIVGSLMPDNDYLVSSPTGREDTDGSDTVSSLIMSSLAAPGSFRANFEHIQDSVAIGNGYLHVGWELLREKVLKRTPAVDEFGNATSQFSYREATIKDNIFFRSLPFRDMFRDPSASKFEDSEGAAFRFRITADRAMELSEPQPDAPSGFWDREEVEEAIKTMSKKEDHQFQDHTRQQFYRELPDNYNQLPGFAFWGRVPFKPGSGEFHADAIRRRLIIIWGGRVVLNRPNPILGGPIPIIESVPNPITSRPHGLSPLEVIRFIQDSADVLRGLIQDAAIEAARGTLLVGQGAGISPQELRRRKVGDILKVMDPKMLSVLPLQTNGLFQAAGELLNDKLVMRQATGAEDSLQGIKARGQQSATQFAGLLQSASSRSGIMAQMLERESFPALGRLILRLHQQFIPDEGALMRRVGEKRSFRINLFDIDGDFDLTFMGSSRAISQRDKNLQLKDIIQTLGNNPFIASRVEWPQLIALWLEEGAQRKDFEKFLASPERAERQLETMGLLRAGGSTPTSGVPGGNAIQAEQLGVSQ